MRAGPNSVFTNCPFCGQIMFFPKRHLRWHARRLVESIDSWRRKNSMNPGHGS